MTTKLKAALRKIARRFDDPSSNDELFDCGICYAVQEIYGKHAEAYGEVGSLLHATQEGFNGSLGPYMRRPGWDDRANMCLFLAHWLEDEGH